MNVNVGAFKLELGCDHFKISGGEILRVEVERNFIKKFTAYSAGLGAAASLPSISLGGGSLGDNGKSWSPPGSMATANVTAQVMVTVRVSDLGGVEDVGLKSTVQASGSAGPLKGAIERNRDHQSGERRKCKCHAHSQRLCWQIEGHCADRALQTDAEPESPRISLILFWASYSESTGRTRLALRRHQTGEFAA